MIASQDNAPNMGVTIDNMLSEWGALPYAHLSVLLVYLRYTALVHQTHHWTCKGDSFYGDHLLFERLYNKLVEEADEIAERVVGLAFVENVSLQHQLAQVARLSQSYGASSTIPQPDELARRSLIAENNLIAVIDTCITELTEQGLMTNGLENMLQEISDNHESHVYLLKQRCA